MLENVEEFQDWGPLLDDGTPCPVRKGLTFRRWKKQLENVGYVVECRELRACDYGAPTIRKRLFVIARRDGLPIVWPAPTHGHGLLPYRTAAECIDWSLPCPSIFERKRPLAEATMRRIAKGVKRYVIDTADPFIVPITHTGGDRVHSIREPLRTITTAQRGELALAMPSLVGVGGRMGQSRPRSVEEPMQTITAKADTALVGPHILTNTTGHPGARADEPLRTVTTGGHHALVAAFLAQHNTGMVGHPADKPLSTITARGTQQQIVTSHLTKLYGTCQHGQDNREPMPTITSGGQHIGEDRAFLIKYYGTDQDPQLREPLHTVTTKDRFGIVTVKGEDYVIADIGMRMLQPRELYRAQGVPDSYVIDPQMDGKPLTKTAQVRMCGNSVSPPLAQAIVEANMTAAEHGRRWRDPRTQNTLISATAAPCSAISPRGGLRCNASSPARRTGACAITDTLASWGLSRCTTVSVGRPGSPAASATSARWSRCSVWCATCSPTMARCG